MKLPHPKFPFSGDKLAFVMAAVVKFFVYLLR